MFGGMMDKAELFCGKPPQTFREKAAPLANDADD